MKILYKGEVRSEYGWSKVVGLSPSCIQKRIVKLGWTPEKTLETPLIVNKEISPGYKITKTDGERWLNELTREEIPEMLKPGLSKGIGEKYSAHGTLIRKNHRVLFDKWFHEVFLPDAIKRANDTSIT